MLTFNRSNMLKVMAIFTGFLGGGRIIKKTMALFCLLFLLTACNMVTQKEADPELDISSLSLGMGENEYGTVQYVRYSMILTSSENLKINEKTLEPLLAGWIEERVLDHEIELADEIGDGQLKMEGKVTFDSNGLTKRDIITFEKLEDTIQGVVFETRGGNIYQAVLMNGETKLKKIGD
ncbi:hypothetical protein AB685_18010 [Bacillus sp. LL01]|nr:hypothetical protein AB685_18010 [Bacillus sp. LL01]